MPSNERATRDPRRIAQQSRLKKKNWNKVGAGTRKTTKNRSANMSDDLFFLFSQLIDEASQQQLQMGTWFFSDISFDHHASHGMPATRVTPVPTNPAMSPPGRECRSPRHVWPAGWHWAGQCFLRLISVIVFGITSLFSPPLHHSSLP